MWRWKPLNDHKCKIRSQNKQLPCAVLISPWPFLSVGSDPPTSCCFSYTVRKLPRNFVVDYYETSSLCSQPAVVFQTKRGKQVCADPSETWVQEYVNDLELN
ncbi:PREDICTED: C-C motif chemokine 4-like [Cercocebus atys]|uniref:C-C motif chemokine 4-like n=1 Tax=Cercocebus atys TaxID=9531 RepID=UPI0005F589DC|nr:PREDICTED: C-C motif chemokine 4-like [Cercocebus atys]